MAIKEEFEQLRKEVKDLKKQLAEQNNKWNKIYTVASVASALIALMNLVIAWLNYRK